MVTAAKILLLIYGIFVIAKARVELGGGRYVDGKKARILGAICLVPFPLSYLMTAAGRTMSLSAEIIIVILAVILYIAFGNKYAKTG